MRAFILYGVPAIALLSVAMSYAKRRIDNAMLTEIADRFILNNETSLPTLISIVLMWMAAQLCAMNYAHFQRVDRSPRNLYWIAGAVFLLGMAYDEGAQLHEKLRLPGAGGFLDGQSWIIVGIPIVAIAGVVFLPFLLSPPRRLKIELGKGAAVFVFGAIAVEAMGGLYKARMGADYVYTLITVLEESAELVGIAYVDLALLRYAAQQRIQLRFGDPGRSEE